jgi:hypothetical protein
MLNLAYKPNSYETPTIALLTFLIYSTKNGFIPKNNIKRK